MTSGRKQRQHWFYMHVGKKCAQMHAHTPRYTVYTHRWKKYVLVGIELKRKLKSIWTQHTHAHAHTHAHTQAALQTNTYRGQERIKHLFHVIWLERLKEQNCMKACTHTSAYPVTGHVFQKIGWTEKVTCVNQMHPKDDMIRTEIKRGWHIHIWIHTASLYPTELSYAYLCSQRSPAAFSNT